MSDRANLAAALVKAQAELPKVEPNGTNPHFKSKFVTLDHLLAKVRPVLNKHGLAIVQLPSIGPSGEPALTTTLLHVSGEQMTQQMLLLATKSDPQAQGSALTYARRYALAAVLGISSEDDDDGSRNRVGEPSGANDSAGAAQRPAASPSAPSPADEVFGESAKPDDGTKATAAQIKKLNLLVGPMDQDMKHRVWATVALGRVRKTDDLILDLGGVYDGALHWSPLRDTLTKDEAHRLIDRLEAREREQT